jgi:hypothetical protein
MSDKRLERLKWAIRYIGFHPDMSPSLWVDEYGIDLGLAIAFESSIFADMVLKSGILSEDVDSDIAMADYEKKIFNKLVSLK